MTEWAALALNMSLQVMYLYVKNINFITKF